MRGAPGVKREAYESQHFLGPFDFESIMGVNGVRDLIEETHREIPEWIRNGRPFKNGERRGGRGKKKVQV